MDFLDSFGVSNRSMKMIYCGSQIICAVLTMLLIVFIIFELFNISSQQDQLEKLDVKETTMQFSIPDMKDILLWGYYGQGVTINVSKLYQGHREEYQDGFRKFHLNKYLSDRISMRRPLPDVRSNECQLKLYDMTNLPSVSVVVVFRNEPRTTLLRMLYSVIDRSPAEKLQDIILVDDDTDVEDLKFPMLEHYLSGLKQVSILRLTTYHGIARARMHGALKASGQVIIFLQPRCECTEGWMLPILEQINLDQFSILVPVVDRIDYHTFQYIHDNVSEIMVGTFTWDLAIKKRPWTNSIQNGTTWNAPNPVIADGIFAVYKDNLFKLSGFDVNLMKEDSVNIEFSFRSWMCGYQILLVPCSHVGYLFPQPQAELPGSFSNDTLRENLRIADIWMSDYNQFVRERLLVGVPIEIQHSNNFNKAQKLYKPETNITCNNFEWYLRTVEPMMQFTKEIKRRGQLVLMAADSVFLNVRVVDNRITLQDWPNDQITFWYHLKNGTLTTENKTCLSFAEKDTEEIGFKIGNSDLNSDQIQYKQDTVLDTKAVSVNRHNQNPLIVRFYQSVKSRDRPFNQTLSDFNKSSDVDQLKYLGRESIPLSNEDQHHEIVKKSQTFVYYKNNDEENRYGSKIRSRLRFNTLRFHSDLVRPLAEPQINQGSFSSQDQINHKVSKNELDPLSDSEITMKSCAAETDGDEWIYTETRNLEHVQSGLCMAVQKNTSGKYFLKMAQCNETSWTQQWSFVNVLVS